MCGGSGWRDDDPVGPGSPFRQWLPLPGFPEQAAQPCLGGPVEAPLRPPAEQDEPEPYQGIRNGGTAGVAGDPERDLAGTQILDHFVAEAALLQMALQSLV